MSHFSVLVIGNNIEKQLAQYDENKKVKPYKRECYCISSIAKKEAGERVEKEYKTFNTLREEFKKESDQSDASWKKFIAYYIGLEHLYLIEHSMYNKPDPKCEECKGTGKETTTYNPKSKWDWHQIGGRWAGMLLLKKNAHSGKRGEKSLLDKSNPYSDSGVDSAFKKDIDFEAMQNDLVEKQTAEREWDECVAGNGFYKLEYFVERYGTKEGFVKARLRFTTHAVVKNGKWFEVGRMGWFGCSSETKDEDRIWEEKFFDIFIKPLSANARLTIVDCHI